MTTLFHGESKDSPRMDSGTAVILYALSGVLWLGLAAGNFRDARHVDRAWLQAIAGTIYLSLAGFYLFYWRQKRRAS